MPRNSRHTLPAAGDDARCPSAAKPRQFTTMPAAFTSCVFTSISWLHQRVELRRRDQERIGAELRQPPAQHRGLQRLDDLGMQLVADRRRRLRRHEHAGPEIVLGVRIAGLDRGRHVGQRRGALRATHRQRLQRALAQEGDRVRERREVEVEPAGDHLGQRLGRAALRHVHGLELRREAEALAVEMGGVAGTGGGVVDRAGIFARVVHEIGERLVALLRIDRHHHRHVAERDHAGEIGEHVERQLRARRRRDGVGRGIGQDGVAVGLGLRHRRHADGVAGARAVLDDERLAELRRHLLEHRARHDVGRGAGGERDDHADRRASASSCADAGVSAAATYRTAMASSRRRMATSLILPPSLTRPAVITIGIWPVGAAAPGAGHSIRTGTAVR